VNAALDASTPAKGSGVGNPLAEHQDEPRRVARDGARGSILVAGLTAAFIRGIHQNQDVPTEIASSVEVELAAGNPFVSDADLEAALVEGGVTTLWRTSSLTRTKPLGSPGCGRAFPSWGGWPHRAVFTRMIPIEPVGASSEGSVPSGATT
jgi:hypothetical protein